MVIFLDLGAYRGETTRDFLNGKIFEHGRECSVVQAFDFCSYPKEWQAVKDEFPNVSISFNQKAVGVTDGIATFGAWPENPEAQTMYPECVNYNNRPLQQVERIDFVGWIQRFTQLGNIVVCKMDIEGAEYDILEGLINTGAINRINYLYCEFHDWIFSKEYEERHRKIVERCPIPVGGWG